MKKSINTRKATMIGRIKRKKNGGDTRPTFRRLGIIAKKLRNDLALPSCTRLGLELECSYKTIQRDIDLLRNFFLYPLEWDNIKFCYVLTGAIPKAVL